MCPDCGEYMFLYSKERHPLQATFDHIIPMVLIQKHTIDNLRMCCRDCNEKKAADYTYVFYA